MTVTVTKHAQERLKERNGLSKASANRMAKRAYMEGVPYIAMKGRLSKWVTKSVKGGLAPVKDARLYGDKLFLFDGTTLITVLQVPYNIMKQVNKMIDYDCIFTH